MINIKTEKFKSVKSKGLLALLVIMSLLFIVATVVLPIISDRFFTLLNLIVTILIVIPAIGLFFWCWWGTYYLIEPGVLKVKYGPFSWAVPIHEISSIRLDQNTIGGNVKPTLAWKCIEVSYRTYKSISISPVNQDKFISILKEKNSSIKIR